MINANRYRDAIQLALSGADPVDVPPMECTEMMLQVRLVVPDVDLTLLTVNWRRESLFYQRPGSNPRGDGGADVGPLQLATTYWDKAPYTDGLSNPFGTTRSAIQPFDGEPFENLIVAARALNEVLVRAKRNRAVAAGLYRAGHIDAAPGSPYLSRKAEFEGVAERYDAFFSSLGGQH